MKLVKSFVTLEEIVEHLKSKYEISSEFEEVDDENKGWSLYLKQVQIALLTFRHQVVQNVKDKVFDQETDFKNSQVSKKYLMKLSN